MNMLEALRMALVDNGVPASVFDAWVQRHPETSELADIMTDPRPRRSDSRQLMLPLDARKGGRQ